MKDDLATYWQWMEQHGEEVGRLGGRIMGWYRGPNPVITTTCPEILKEVTSSLAIAVIPYIPVLYLPAGVHQGRGELRGPSPAGPQRQHPAPHQHAGPGLEESEVQSTH